MTDLFVILLGVVWIGWTGFFLYARRGAEALLRRWGEAAGLRIVEARRVKMGMFNPHRLLHVSAVQVLYDIRVQRRDGSRYPMMVSVGDRWLGSLREAVTVIEDDGRQVVVHWRNEPAPGA